MKPIIFEAKMKYPLKSQSSELKEQIELMNVHFDLLVLVQSLSFTFSINAALTTKAQLR